MLNTALFLNESLFSSEVETGATRDGFGEAIIKLAEKNQNIVALTADLKESVRLLTFAERYPERFIQCGIAEQNMASIGAGLALSGKTPFITSHAVFMPSTNWAQIRQSICLNRANVKIVGSHQGFSNGPDGPMAEPLEDVALMRVLPNMIVINPIDYIQTTKAIEASAEHEGPVYLRLGKAKTAHITTEKTPFEIGKGLVLKEGTKATLVTSGPITAEVMFAARKLLKDHEIDVEVLAVPTIKPLDEQIIIKSAKKTGLIFTIEEHQVAGGLGSAIAEMLSQKSPTQMHIIGVEDTFGKSGRYKELLKRYNLDAQSIVNKVLEVTSD